MREDARLLVAAAAGCADHSLSARAELFFPHAVQFVVIDDVAEVFDLRDMQAGHAALGGLASDKTDETEEMNACRAQGMTAFDGINDTVELAFAPVGCKHGRGNEQIWHERGMSQSGLIGRRPFYLFSSPYLWSEDVFGPLRGS